MVYITLAKRTLWVYIVSMTLSDYLKNNGISAARFARDIGCTRGAVYNWLKGIKRPDSDNYARIYELTGGEVAPNDFYRLPAVSRTESAP